MVKIGEKHMIKGDGTTFMACDVLTYPEGTKSGRAGENYYRPFAYASTFSQALAAVFKAKCRDVCAGSEIISLEMAISAMRRVEAEMQEILQERAGGL